ncbi:MAG: hypothetical protein HDQ96_16245 [Lachnospiraceae bacterium]|nr:hypothetical protein [Lachnospiraceae bacterium]
MWVQAIPVFQDIHILRKSMLETLSDYTFLTDRLRYKGYGNGILAGCELTTTGDSIVLNEGIIFFEEQMFLIKEPISIIYHPTNTTIVLKICFSDQVEKDNFICREIDLMLTEEMLCKKGELELCRFKLQEGAKLRFLYQDFGDRNTEFDTLNTIYAPYSVKGGSTLSPDILREFAEEMLKTEELSVIDELFGLQILGKERPTDLKTLASYLERRDRKKMQEISNIAIYKELARILREVKYGEKAETGSVKKRWNIMVE